METIGERIKKRREMLGMKQEELAEKTGYKSDNRKSAISKIEKNRNDLSRSKITIFAQALETTEAYLMGWIDDPDLTREEILSTNVVKKFNTPQTIAMDTSSSTPITIDTDNNNIDNYNINDQYILNVREKNHIKLYRRLNEVGKKNIDDYIVLLAETSKYTDTPIEKTVISIIYYDTPVSAGTGEYIDSDNYIMLDVMETPPPGTEFIVRVCGDSMEPTYKDGDKLFIKPQEDVSIGEIGIFSINGDVYVKERDVDGLISHNELYNKIMFSENDTLKCFGKVLGVCTKYR